MFDDTDGHVESSVYCIVVMIYMYNKFFYI